MQTLESLSDALATTRDIRAIVRTMKALSAVSIRQYEQAEIALEGYGRTVELGLSALLRDRGAHGLPLPGSEPASGREALIVIGSDRGLCGRYNETIVRYAQTRISADTALLAVIGARAVARFEGSGRSTDQRFSLPGSVGGLTQAVGDIILRIDRWTQEGGIGRIRLVHNRRRGRSSADPHERCVLPIPEAELEKLAHGPWPGPGLPFFRMPPARLFSWLVQQRIFVMLYRALAEALASEHATRLAAMQRAERNIDERLEKLTDTHRRKRQETITRELLDVVAGFEAVSADGI